MSGHELRCPRGSNRHSERLENRNQKARVERAVICPQAVRVRGIGPGRMSEWPPVNCRHGRGGVEGLVLVGNGVTSYAVGTLGNFPARRLRTYDE